MLDFFSVSREKERERERERQGGFAKREPARQDVQSGGRHWRGRRWENDEVADWDGLAICFAKIRILRLNNLNSRNVMPVILGGALIHPLDHPIERLHGI